MTTTYKQRECYKCGVAIVVPQRDDSADSYCQACAFSKLGANLYDNRTEKESDDE